MMLARCLTNSEHNHVEHADSTPQRVPDPLVRGAICAHTQLSRDDFESLGLDEPASMESHETPAGHHHFLLSYLPRHWSLDYTITLTLRGSLVALEALDGGQLMRDMPGEFDDWLAEAEGLRMDEASQNSGHLSSIHDRRAASDDRAPIITRRATMDLGDSRASSRGVMAVRLTGRWGRLRAAGRGHVDSIESIQCERTRPPSPPPTVAPQRVPPSPPDAPWSWRYTAPEHDAALAGVDATTGVAEHLSSASSDAMNTQSKYRAFGIAIPARYRNILAGTLQGIYPIVYTGCGLAALTCIALCLRRLCCSNHDREHGPWAGRDGTSAAEDEYDDDDDDWERRPPRRARASPRTASSSNRARGQMQMKRPRRGGGSRHERLATSEVECRVQDDPRCGRFSDV